jgi:uncharacterized membrane protein
VTDYPPQGATHSKRPLPVLARLAATAGTGALAGTIAAFVAPWQTVPLVVWDVTALTWVLTVWLRVARLDAVATSLHATSEDPRRALADTMLLSASVASLVGVVLGTIKASSAHGGEKFFLLGVGILAIVSSWGMVHTIFTLRYAALFYTGPDGGVDFNEEEEPCYADFAYLAFTIGMTYQVSDTDLTIKSIRHTALRHALLSYVFGTVIVATTINLAAGLVK